MIIKRTLTRDMPNRDRIVAHLELRIADEGQRFVGGLSPGFSATCEIYEARSNASGAARQKMGRDADSGGADHEAILRAFPQLDRFVELHLSDPDGVPMHALANSWYWYSHWDGKGTHGVPGRSDYEVACRTLRVGAIPAEIPRQRNGEGNIPAEFVAFVDAQRERWANEAREARKMLESLPND